MCMLSKLDASKAFDHVQYCKLLNELVNHNISLLVLRLLLNMYTKQTLQVRWGNDMSQQYTVCNGVKQGGVLSPILFAVYINGLFDRLNKRGIGCYMGNSYVGAMGYTDDIKLLCPSLNGMQQMVDMCVDYADEYNIKFNGSKSCILLFKGRQCKDSQRMLIIDGVIIHCSESVSDLGHNVSQMIRIALLNQLKPASGEVLIFSDMILGIFILLQNVNYFSSIVALFMVHHCGH